MRVNSQGGGPASADRNLVAEVDLGLLVMMVSLKTQPP